MICNQGDLHSPQDRVRQQEQYSHKLPFLLVRRRERYTVQYGLTPQFNGKLDTLDLPPL